MIYIYALYGYSVAQILPSPCFYHVWGFEREYPSRLWLWQPQNCAENTDTGRPVRNSLILVLSYV